MLQCPVNASNSIPWLMHSSTRPRMTRTMTLFLLLLHACHHPPMAPTLHAMYLTLARLIPVPKSLWPPSPHPSMPLHLPTLPPCTHLWCPPPWHGPALFPMYFSQAWVWLHSSALFLLHQHIYVHCKICPTILHGDQAKVLAHGLLQAFPQCFGRPWFDGSGPANYAG